MWLGEDKKNNLKAFRPCLSQKATKGLLTGLQVTPLINPS